MTALQITFDGREVPVPDTAAPRTTAPLSELQRAVLAHIRDQGAITSTDAGVLVHVSRPAPKGPACAALRRANGGRKACCQYAAGDGLDVCKRLLARGLVRRTARGRWEAAS